MSELKVYKDVDDYVGYDETPEEMYDKYEADLVIKELQTELEAKELDFSNLKEDALNTDKAREKWFQLARKQAIELRHHKYKRCAAMARWCLTEKVYFHYRYDDWGDRGYDRPYKWKKVVFWSKWARRWLELAEKFKDKEA